MKKIPLTQGRFAIVDADDFDRLSKYSWCVSKCNGRFYVVGSVGKKKVYMHRFILSTPKGMQTDHINGNALDNRKKNLRICKAWQNAGNKTAMLGTSKYKGVSWSTDKGKWEAAISFKGERFRRRFSEEKKAAAQYNEWAKEIYKEYALLNVID